MFLNEFDNVGRIVGEHPTAGTLDVLAQLIVDVELLLCDGEDKVDRVFLDFLIDLRNGRIILSRRVSVRAFPIHVAKAVIRLDNTSQLDNKKRKWITLFSLLSEEHTPFHRQHNGS